MLKLTPVLLDSFKLNGILIVLYNIIKFASVRPLSDNFIEDGC